MKRFVTVLISVGLLAGLIGCSESSDEIAELRAELDATRAELTELTSMKDDYSEKEEYKDKDDGLVVSYEETVDFFTICFASDIVTNSSCGHVFDDVIVLRRLVLDDEVCQTKILVSAIRSIAFIWSVGIINASRHGGGPDDAYLVTPPPCVGLDNEDS